MASLIADKMLKWCHFKLRIYIRTFHVSFSSSFLHVEECVTLIGSDTSFPPPHHFILCSNRHASYISFTGFYAFRCSNDLYRHILIIVKQVNSLNSLFIDVPPKLTVHVFSGQTEKNRIKKKQNVIIRTYKFSFGSMNIWTSFAFFHLQITSRPEGWLSSKNDIKNQMDLVWAWQSDGWFFWEGGLWLSFSTFMERFFTKISRTNLIGFNPLTMIVQRYKRKTLIWLSINEQSCDCWNVPFIHPCFPFSIGLFHFFLFKFNIITNNNIKLRKLLKNWPLALYILLVFH